MLGRVLAVISPADTPHGYNLTFAFPMLLFIIIAGALYLRFRSPHKVPGHLPMALGGAPAGSAEAGQGGAGQDGRNGQDEAADGAETSE